MTNCCRQILPQTRQITASPPEFPLVFFFHFLPVAYHIKILLNVWPYKMVTSLRLCKSVQQCVEAEKTHTFWKDFHSCSGVKQKKKKVKSKTTAVALSEAESWISKELYCSIKCRFLEKRLERCRYLKKGKVLHVRFLQCRRDARKFSKGCRVGSHWKL